MYCYQCNDCVGNPVYLLEGHGERKFYCSKECHNKFLDELIADIEEDRVKEEDDSKS